MANNSTVNIETIVTDARKIRTLFCAAMGENCKGIDGFLLDSRCAEWFTLFRRIGALFFLPASLPRRMQIENLIHCIYLQRIYLFSPCAKMSDLSIFHFSSSLVPLFAKKRLLSNPKNQTRFCISRSVATPCLG